MVIPNDNGIVISIFISIIAIIMTIIIEQK